LAQEIEMKGKISLSPKNNGLAFKMERLDLQLSKLEELWLLIKTYFLKLLLQDL